LANPELGTKQICPQCQAKFYDLNKRPAHCPKCATEFDPDEAVRNRRVRARAITPDTETDDERAAQVRGKQADSDDEEDEVAAPELDEVADEPLVDDDDEAAEPVGGPAADDLAEFPDDEVEDEADDVPFLEDDEDDDFDDTDIEVPSDDE
jgi:uncharacterized protein (TIGR02300 family)